MLAACGSNEVMLFSMGKSLHELAKDITVINLNLRFDCKERVNKKH